MRWLGMSGWCLLVVGPFFVEVLVFFREGGISAATTAYVLFCPVWGSVLGVEVQLLKKKSVLSAVGCS
jgi:hypothetical protein